VKRPKEIASAVEVRYQGPAILGQGRLEAATPSVRGLEDAIERDFTADEIATVKAWLVASAQRLEEILAEAGSLPPRPGGLSSL
jgi:hypothetical protein